MVGHGLLTLRQTVDAFDIGQRLAVAGINGGTALHHLRHVLELQKAKGGVDFAHLGVDTGDNHSAFVDKTKVFEMVDALFGFSVGADNGAALEGIEDFGGVKAQYRQVAMVQHTATMALYAKGVGSIVDDPEIVVISNFLNGIYIARVAITMHRHDGGGLGCNGGLNLSGVEV